MLQRELERGAHVRLELLEAREGLGKELAQALMAVRGLGLEAADRAEALRHHRGDQLAAAGEAAIGGGARHARMHRHLRNRGHMAAADELHGGAQHPALGVRPRALGGNGSRHGKRHSPGHGIP